MSREQIRWKELRRSFGIELNKIYLKIDKQFVYNYDIILISYY
ncbi:hypothetical protein CLVI_23340 [Clostridium vincentii]|uniref:Uncharacterized protein n=1 Tax=Clostridium vincentii TaxID=52704 RepID=A0A2T0BCI7_9CLOT|nr:hypothetical protein CLVI_23340 [Clostridium vincentii]